MNLMYSLTMLIWKKASEAATHTHTHTPTHRASVCLPVSSMSPLRAMNVSLPQQRKMPDEKWGRPEDHSLVCYCMLGPTDNVIHCGFHGLWTELSVSEFPIPASIPDQLAPAAVMQSLPANYTIWGTPSKLEPSCYPCKRKERPVPSSANFHQM